MSLQEPAPLTPHASDTDATLDGILTEDKKKFKTCSQIGFYRRQKLLLPGQSPYYADLETVIVDKGITTLQIINQDTKVPLQLQIIPCESIFRLKINEISPLKPRYEVPDVIVKDMATERLSVSQRESGSIVLENPNGPYKIHITAQPFSVSVTADDKLLLSLNSQGLLYFECLVSPQSKSAILESDSDVTKDEYGLWREKFGEFVDIKASGPTSVGLDVSLHGFEYVYGLPEHADTHRLQNTEDNDAYRLYNLDVFAYKVYDKMGTYGSVPLLLAHKPLQTCGLFWLNASETLVEINTRAVPQSSLSRSVPDTRKQRAIPQTEVRWMSESGIVDLFLLMGPSPQDVFRQYAHLTGFQALPPLFSLGYHQCRWNYEDEADVEAVDLGFDLNNIPYDVIWLDIEHTDGKRYFTWDPERFRNPTRMQEQLKQKKRKLVVISDPHIKVDPDYSLYSQAKARGYFVKDRDGQDFEGNCWPGTSCYLDFTNPAVRDWYAAQYALDSYKDSTEVLFVWNDMNEPSVFEAPEMTMPKSAVHYKGCEHRDLHNLYGFYQQMSTFKGLIQRSAGQERPFVLTRSFFAGSQRYGAVWTGDNKADWEYLKISVPMLLTLNVTGISFCGADVGGFVGDPEPELLIRWYQAGAFQPFFRAHAVQNSKRREPWLFGKDNILLLKRVIEERYTLLPFWYLLFYQAHVSAQPVMRPLWVEFPKHPESFGEETQYMLGSALLVVPVLAPGVSALDVLFPGSGERWYNFRKYECMRGPHRKKIKVTLDEIPVFQRGGSIIPLHTRVGKSTGWMDGFPYELRVALDSKGFAEGELFLDDGHSFNYIRDSMFTHRKFALQKNVLSSSSADSKGKYQSESIVERVQLMGVKKQPLEVILHSSGVKTNVAFTYSAKLCLLSLESLSLCVSTDWEIHIRDK
ncbi:neutral alpha-glucosidase C [Xenopus laevis]|uniref:Neutral alpha-glucosidase C n=2 Tax=Xenopus laevis TaxID=8355 RepID=A0A1L8FAY2_XENLA|nr:neutral alpha-glucosidase C [Xenopus laevis]OCT68743.1 hypothetical protein XELAEV_18040030mg [Xenopus laevis]